jgi:hypothetical protein
LELLELLEGALGGAFVGVEAALETLEAVFEVAEGGTEISLAEADVTAIVGLVIEDVVQLETMFPEVGFHGAKAADIPLVVDQGVYEVTLAGGGRAELGVVFGGELREGFGIFAADDVGLGVNAGFQGISATDSLRSHARGLLTGVGAGAGGFLRIQAIREDLLFGCHL